MRLTDLLDQRLMLLCAFLWFPAMGCIVEGDADDGDHEEHLEEGTDDPPSRAPVIDSGAPSKPNDAGASDDEQVCAAGQQVACACLGGSEGVQVCKSDGSGFEECEGCEAPEMPAEADAGAPTLADDFALYQVRILSVEVSDKTAGDTTWDAFGGAPDVFVCAGYDGAQGCTAVCEDNSTRCAFVDDDGLLGTLDQPAVTFFGTELAAGLPLSVWDRDAISTDDSIGSGLLLINSHTMQPESTGPFGQVLNLELQIEEAD